MQKCTHTVLSLSHTHTHAHTHTLRASGSSCQYFTRGIQKTHTLSFSLAHALSLFLSHTHSLFLSLSRTLFSSLFDNILHGACNSAHAHTHSLSLFLSLFLFLSLSHTHMHSHTIRLRFELSIYTTVFLKNSVQTHSHTHTNTHQVRAVNILHGACKSADFYTYDTIFDLVAPVLAALPAALEACRCVAVCGDVLQVCCRCVAGVWLCVAVYNTIFGLVSPELAALPAAGHTHSNSKKVCSVWQCVAVCGSVWQCVAVVLQVCCRCVVVCCRCVAGVLQVCCSVLQCVAACCSGCFSNLLVLQVFGGMTYSFRLLEAHNSSTQFTKEQYNTAHRTYVLQCIAVCCSVLQCDTHTQS